MPLLLLTALFIWMAPAVKVFGNIALWHLALAALLYISFINPARFRGYLSVAYQNRGLIFLMLLYPAYIVVRNELGGELGEESVNILLRGFGGLLFAISVGVYCREREDREKLVKLLVLVLFVHSIVGILQFVYPETFYSLPDLLVENPEIDPLGYEGRVRGMFLNIHIFGQQMLGLVSFFFALAVLRGKEVEGPGRSDRYLWAAIMAGVVAIALTYLRAAYLGLVLDFFLIIFIFKNRGMSLGRKVSALAVFIVLLVGINVWLGTFETETSNRIIGGGASLADAKRFGSYVAAFQSFREAPVFGVGIEKNIYYMAVHNIFLQVMAFSGLAGLVFYLLFFIALFRKIILLPVQHSSYRAGLILWLVTYLLYDMSHTSGFWVSGLQEWTFVGILISLASSRDFSRGELKGPGAG
jgi:hypothetical protein